MTARRRHGWARADRGNVAVWFALASMAIAGLGAGALTLTRLNGSATRLQDLADGAALAAVVQAQAPAASDDDIKDAARRFDGGARTTATAEFDEAAMQVRILGRAPPEVSVSLTQEVHTIMAALVGRDSIAIRRQATAVAGEERRTCLHVLDPAATKALKVHGSAHITAADCIIQVNSSAQDPIHSWGSSSVSAEATFAAGPGASRLRKWAATPSFGAAARPDPLAPSRIWPTPVREEDCIEQAGYEPVLKPGHYCGGLEIGRAGGGSRLEPGLYVVQSGGVSVKGRNPGGQGVTIVMLDPGGDFDIGGGSSLKLGASTSGDWSGVVIAAKPGAGMPSSRWQGHGVELDGTVYMPGHRVEVWGSLDVGGSSKNRAFIVRQMEVHGSATLDLAGGHPSGLYRTARLTK